MFLFNSQPFRIKGLSIELKKFIDLKKGGTFEKQKLLRGLVIV